MPLEAECVAKQFGAVSAIEAFDLTITAGVIGLVGPNGAGKSTLLRMWMGFERPTAGHVRVEGIEPRQDPERALAGVAYLAQTPSLYRELTPADHIGFVAHYRSGTFDQKHAKRRLMDLGVPLDQPAGTLSGGQAAQLGLGLALGTRPRILLLDEPLASLDPLARLEFAQVLLDDVRDAGTVVVLSSHVVPDIEVLCDRLVVLGQGRKVVDDDTRSITATHWIVRATDSSHGSMIGAAPSVAGHVVVRSEAAPASARPATLEEAVLAYLAKSRAPVPL